CASAMMTWSSRGGLPWSFHASPSAGIALGSPSCSSSVTARSASRGSLSFFVHVEALYGLSGQPARASNTLTRRTRFMSSPLLVLDGEQQVVEPRCLGRHDDLVDQTRVRLLIGLQNREAVRAHVPGLRPDVVLLIVAGLLEVLGQVPQPDIFLD